MNTKNKFIVFFIFFSVITLASINIKNNEKTKFYIFTSKTEEISLGNLITLTFISGFTFSSLLNLISKNNLEKTFEDNFINYEADENSDENFTKELKSDRPPERDVRDSQPTISVNYRFVDQENEFYSSKDRKNTKNNLNNEENDWLDNDNDW